MPGTSGSPGRWPGGQVRRVPVPGGSLAVETLGEGVPVLLLHGWTLDRRLWLPQLPLTDRFMLVGIDRRGFGQSDAPADVGAEPDDVLHIADALGLSRFHLLGMSQGGKVALNVAARAPGRVASLVLQGSALDGVAGPDEAVPVAAMTAAAQAGDLATLRAIWAAHPLVRLTSDRGAATLAAMLADYVGRDLLAGRGVLAGDSAMVAELAMPVLAVVGDSDTPQRQAIVAALAEAGAEAQTLAGAGHLANLDQPGAFNALLEEWWQRVG
ncbi:alpha/beta fold hydrolase [Polymorphobacter sp.]|uniref:alpha/beta fold hydrolase n=1 Tax=Polymorphobacter sp. TaxID=1909290 RepID=UPI003F722567